MIFSPFTHYHPVSTFGPVMSGSGIGGLGDLTSVDLTTPLSTAPSEWGIQEYLIVGIGGYLLLDLFFKGRKVHSKVSPYVSKYRAKSIRRGKLERELSGL